jgi:RNA polymerase sigma factor (TIGR02999 family)
MQQSFETKGLGMTPQPEDITQWLVAWGNGDQVALEKLMPLVYAELHRIAGRYMERENTGHTLQTTALIHEAYLRLANPSAGHWQNRAHFFGVAARVMRHILVDYARARHQQKHGGGAQHVSFDEAAVVSPEPSAELIALDDALRELEAVDERRCRVVELRYFGGLSVEEAAEVLKVSPVTVARDWSMAKAWLYRALNQESQ